MGTLSGHKAAEVQRAIRGQPASTKSAPFIPRGSTLGVTKLLQVCSALLPPARTRFRRISLYHSPPFLRIPIFKGNVSCRACSPSSTPKEFTARCSASRNDYHGDAFSAINRTTIQKRGDGAKIINSASVDREHRTTR